MNPTRTIARLAGQLRARLDGRRRPQEDHPFRPTPAQDRLATKWAVLYGRAQLSPLERAETTTAIIEGRDATGLVVDCALVDPDGLQIRPATAGYLDHVRRLDRRRATEDLRP